MAARTEDILELVWDMADACNGFGMDFGGSVIKVIYLHVDDWQEPEKRTKPMAPYRLVNFARDEFDDAMKYLKPRVCIRRNAQDADEKPLLYTCGIGGSQFATEIRKTFDIRCTNITEMECLFESFRYLLKHQTLGDMTVQVDPEDIKAYADQARKASEFLGFFAKDNTNLRLFDASSQKDVIFPLEVGHDVSKRMSDVDDVLPCLYVLGGSNGAAFMVNADGSYELATDMNRAGRMTMGLASLLTGCKSYDEFMALAERGNMRLVHEYASDVTDGIDKNEDNFYAKILERKPDDHEEPGFLFGKCVYKDLSDFRREDLAMALLYSRMLDWACIVHDITRSYPQVKHVFFGGGYTSHPLARRLIAKRWILKECYGRTVFEKKSFTHIHFLRHSQHFGALGSLLNQKLKFKVVNDGASK